MKILMVCLGNICRSPLAQGIMEEKIKLNNLDWEVDSCGTGSWHIGYPPDKRSVLVAHKNGLDISNQRARQLSYSDFDRFDLILAMDAQNYQDIKSKGGENAENKVKLILNYLFPGENRGVPDPYFEGGFDQVYQLLDSVSDKIIDSFR